MTGRKESPDFSCRPRHNVARIDRRARNEPCYSRRDNGGPRPGLEYRPTCTGPGECHRRTDTEAGFFDVRAGSSKTIATREQPEIAAHTFITCSRFATPEDAKAAPWSSFKAIRIFQPRREKSYDEVGLHYGSRSTGSRDSE